MPIHTSRGRSSRVAAAVACLLIVHGCSQGGSDEAASDNESPLADAGGDRVVTEGSEVVLDGTASRDPDGTLTAFQWSQLEGPGVVLQDADAAVSRFTAPGVASQTRLRFSLEVTDDDGETSAANVAITVVDEDAISGLDERPANPSCVAPPRPRPAAVISLSQPFPLLPAFERPLALLQAPGDAARWFVVEQPGRVQFFDNDPAVASFEPFVDIVARVNSGPNEAGLLGMAFHPDFGGSGPHADEVFLSYTAGPPLVSRISRFRLVAGDPDALDPASEEVLLELDQDAGNHNGGQITFGPDGMLYASFGDGGGAGDPLGRAQDTMRLLGSILRLDVDGGAPYAIPADNPFAGAPLCDDGVGGEPCPEIYAWGLRNPWRSSFDRDTGELWVGDVGQNTWEEVDRVERGGNYGWPIREAAHCYPAGSGCSAAGLVDPVVEYGRGDGNSITGGFVYRGEDVPVLRGSYVYGDFGSGRIWGLFLGDAGVLEAQELADTSLGISSFGEALDGELFVLDLFAGAIHRIDPGNGGSGDSLPALLSQTGCVDPAAPTLPASGLVPYDLNAPFWSDGAQKQRWIGLPDGASISLDPEGDFELPPGAVLMKSFSLAGALVETRLFMRHPDGVWAGYSYEWNDAQTEATLVAGGKVKQAAGVDWIFPSGSQCMECHTATAGRSLGPEVAQLNRDFTYPSTGRTANQLDTLAAIGFLDALPDLPANLPALPDPFGAAAEDARARAYLHTNCAPCHRPLGPTPVNFDVRYQTPFVDTYLCDVPPQEGDLGIEDARLVLPGDASSSILALRPQRRDALGMPPLASSLPDGAGIALLDSWIDGLAGCP